MNKFVDVLSTIRAKEIIMTLITFIAKDGTQITGELVHQYPAFEGGVRYIIENHGRQYRCVKKDGRFIELVI